MLKCYIEVVGTAASGYALDIYSFNFGVTTKNETGLDTIFFILNILLVVLLYFLILFSGWLQPPDHCMVCLDCGLMMHRAATEIQIPGDRFFLRIQM